MIGVELTCFELEPWKGVDGIDVSFIEGREAVRGDETGTRGSVFVVVAVSAKDTWDIGSFRFGISSEGDVVVKVAFEGKEETLRLCLISGVVAVARSVVIDGEGDGDRVIGDAAGAGGGE